MLHRRTNTDTTNARPSLASPVPTISTPPKQNTAYRPLRRPSQNLYASPQSGVKPRYNLPSPSPGLTVNTAGHGLGGNGYGFGGAYDLTPDYGAGSSSKSGPIDYIGNVRGVLDRLRRGLEDACRIDKSLTMVFGDRELRTLVLKSTIINLVSLLLLSASPLLVPTRKSLSVHAQHTTQSVGLWYNVLLSWPVFVLCFWINSFWAPVISRRAQTVLHPAYRHQPPSSPMPKASTSYNLVTDNIISKGFTAIQRVLMIFDFTLVAHLIALIPIIGTPVSLAYMGIIDAHYAFDPTFASKGWGLDRKIAYLQERLAYMIGFGLPATIITSFGPPLVNMAIFALIYPFFVIQALLARPPMPRDSLLPSTPSPQSSHPTSPDGTQNLGYSPLFGAARPSGMAEQKEWRLDGRVVPIFFFARHALLVLRWFEVALLRDRGANRRGASYGIERPGKRPG